MQVLANGLVAVFLLKAAGKNFPQTICGFDPSVAAKLVADKIATYDLSGNTWPGSGQSGSEQPAADTKVAARIQADKPAKAKPAAKPKAPSGPVEIPANWQDLHYLQHVKMARAIAGENAPDQMTKDLAVKIISAEVARRASTEGETSNAPD